MKEKEACISCVLRVIELGGRSPALVRVGLDVESERSVCDEVGVAGE